MTSATQAKELHRSALVVDGTSFFCEGWNDRLEIAGVTALQMTVPWVVEGARAAIGRIEEYYELVRREPRLDFVTDLADVQRMKDEDRVGFIIGCQDGSILEADTGLVEVFWRLGMRAIQLTYNARNLLGDGCLEPENAGLSQLGRRMIAEFNRVGMQLDLSHVGERTTLDAIDASSRPVIFSHSNPITRAPSPRNVTDEQIKKCAARGGVIGATPFAPGNWTGGDKAPDIDDFVGHVEYIADLVGIDHVAFGTDSEATPGAYPVELRAWLGRTYPESSSRFKEVHPDVATSAGLESMEGLPAVTAKLLEREWPEEDIRKFLGGNLLRVYDENWDSSEI
jgi:membrane dipeptidase